MRRRSSPSSGAPSRRRRRGDNGLAGRTYSQPWCPLASSLDLLGERWTLLIVRELLFAHPEPRRFGELLAELPGISRSLLSTRLRELEAAGLAEAHTNGAARAVKGWGLTEAGVALAPTLRALGEWGLSHAPGPSAADEGGLRRRLSSLG